MTTPDRSRHARRRLVCGAAVLACSLLGTTQLAGAAPIERERFHDETDEVSTECPGLRLRIQDVVDGSFMGVPHGRNGLIHFSEHVRGTTTITNLATGRTITIQYRFNTRDVHVTDNGDGTLTIDVHSTGRQKVFGPDGERLFIDAGLTAFSILVDHAGTPTDPRDDEEIEFLGITKQAGRHDTAERDFCEDVAAITG